MRFLGLTVPDRKPEIGRIQARGGFFDGEFHRWPCDSTWITIQRPITDANEVVSCTYEDSGDVIFEDGERVRIFDLSSSATYTQKEPRE